MTEDYYQFSSIWAALNNIDGSYVASDERMYDRWMKVNLFKKWGYIEIRDGVYHLTPAALDFFHGREILLINEYKE